MFGALIGTSTTTSYIESAAGVSAGGRTGLTAAFVGVFFLLALFFAPLAGMVPAYASAAALLYVACVMARGLAEIDWEDITEYAPAVVTAIAMPLTYSIATGIGLGFITYALAKLIGGKAREASPAVIVLAALFAVKFAVRDDAATTRFSSNAFLIARKSRQAKRFCSGLRNRKAGWKVGMARISRLPVSKVNQRPRVLVMPSLMPSSACADGPPRQTRMSGSASSIWRRMNGRQICDSCGVGVAIARRPPRHDVGDVD